MLSTSTRLAAFLVLHVAGVVTGFLLAPRATAFTFELAGIVGAARLGWWMHTWPEHAWKRTRGDDEVGK